MQICFLVFPSTIMLLAMIGMRAILQSQTPAAASGKEHAHLHFWVSFSIVVPLLLDIAFHEISLRTSRASLHCYHPFRLPLASQGPVLMSMHRSFQEQMSTELPT